jgi:predicted Abi (CAAX) family protease
MASPTLRDYPGRVETATTPSALRTTTLLTAQTTFLFLFLVNDLSVLPYAMLFVMGIAVAYIWESANKKAIGAGRGLLDIEDYRLSNALYPIVGAVALGMGFLVFMLALANPPVSPTSTDDKIRIIIVQVFIVATVEEFVFRHVFAQVLLGGPITAQILFALSHPQVNRFWFSGQFPIDSIVFFFFALLAGGVFQLVVLLRYRLRGPGRKFFGLLAATALHGIYNAVVTIWTLEVAGVTFDVF